MSSELNKKLRLDVALRLWGFAPSRAKAKELIVSGAVTLKRENVIIVLKDEAFLLSHRDKNYLTVADSDIIKYVSRAGRKLEGALRNFQISPKGLTILDVGQSTGGFTDCLLKAGAEKVVGIDVGHSQLHESLKANSRVECIENCNARGLSNDKAFLKYQNCTFDWIVIDVSFVSLELILPEVSKFLKANGKLIALIKPQFELSASALSKKGVVKDSENLNFAKAKIKRAVEKLNLVVEDIIDSDLLGQDGNREFFIYAHN